MKISRIINNTKKINIKNERIKKKYINGYRKNIKNDKNTWKLHKK